MDSKMLAWSRNQFEKACEMWEILLAGFASQGAAREQGGRRMLWKLRQAEEKGVDISGRQWVQYVLKNCAPDED